MVQDFYILYYKIWPKIFDIDTILWLKIIYFCPFICFCTWNYELNLKMLADPHIIIYIENVQQSPWVGVCVLSKTFLISCAIIPKQNHLEMTFAFFQSQFFCVMNFNNNFILLSCSL